MRANRIGDRQDLSLSHPRLKSNPLSADNDIGVAVNRLLRAALIKVPMIQNFKFLPYLVRSAQKVSESLNIFEEINP